MPESSEVYQPTQTDAFVSQIRRRCADLDEGVSYVFEEPARIQRGYYDYQFFCSVNPNADTTLPPDVRLTHWVSPIWYDEVLFSHDQATGRYVKTVTGAEPVMETVPPHLTVFEAGTATDFELGRVIGILEYLVKQESPVTDEQGTPDLNDVSQQGKIAKVANWLLGR